MEPSCDNVRTSEIRDQRWIARQRHHPTRRLDRFVEFPLELERSRQHLPRTGDARLQGHPASGRPFRAREVAAREPYADETEICGARCARTITRLHRKRVERQLTLIE